MWGAVTSEGNTKILRFERHFPHPADKIWAALTTPERVGDWMCADAVVEPRCGGRFELSFRNGPHQMLGQITRFEPPNVLEYTWPESAANGDSLVLWELASAPGGCLLVLTHTLPGGGEAADFLSGWHWHLDALAEAATGVTVLWNDGEWRHFRDAYRERLYAPA